MANVSDKTLNPEFKLWVEVQLNEHPTQETLRQDLAEKKYNVYGRYNISQVQLTGIENAFFNLLPLLWDKRFDIISRYEEVEHSAYYINLKPEFSDRIEVQPVELIFRLLDSANDDESRYEDRIPVVHKIYISGKEVNSIFEGMKIMEDITEELAVGDYSSCIEAIQDDDHAECEDEGGQRGLTIDISIHAYENIDELDLYGDESLYKSLDESVKSYDDALDVIMRELDDGCVQCERKE